MVTWDECGGNGFWLYNKEVAYLIYLLGPWSFSSESCISCFIFVKMNRAQLFPICTPLASLNNLR